jgi:mannonate dehydratase
MIKLSMVAVPPADEYLAAIAQIGVENLVHYDMSHDRRKFAAFPALVERARRFGLRVPVVEAGPPIDRIVMGKEGWREQIRDWHELLPLLARNGVEVVCYNFMPQLSADAMVVRTDFAARTRGNARTSAFRLADVNPATMPHRETAISHERMWENLEGFLRAVLPTAEAAGLRLAMHPDDPPMTPLCGLERVMSSVEAFDRLLSLSPSPANAMTLCAGCFTQLGVDVPALVRRFGKRIAFTHLRNIQGTPDDFVESFPDVGNLDLVALIRAFAREGVPAYARPDHSPLLATDTATEDGYGFQGHLFTLGYVRGIMAACQ